MKLHTEKKISNFARDGGKERSKFSFSHIDSWKKIEEKNFSLTWWHFHVRFIHVVGIVANRQVARGKIREIWKRSALHDI